RIESAVGLVPAVDARHGLLARLLVHERLEPVLDPLHDGLVLLALLHDPLGLAPVEVHVDVPEPKGVGLRPAPVDVREERLTVLVEEVLEVARPFLRAPERHEAVAYEPGVVVDPTSERRETVVRA